jgi:hypothetical protein
MMPRGIKIMVIIKIITVMMIIYRWDIYYTPLEGLSPRRGERA